VIAVAIPVARGKKSPIPAPEVIINITIIAKEL